MPRIVNYKVLRMQPYVKSPMKELIVGIWPVLHTLCLRQDHMKKAQEENKQVQQQTGSMQKKLQQKANQ